MKKNNLYNKIMNNLSESFEEMELEPVTKKAAYVVETTYFDKLILNKLSNYNIIRTKGSIKFLCPNWQNAMEVANILNDYKCLEKQSLIGTSYGIIKIYKWRDTMNDSLKESIKINESTNDTYSGDFTTEYIYNPTDLDVNCSEERAAYNHIKWLIKKGLQVETKPGRFATKIFIHYEGKEQYEALIKWVAWDMGLSDVISQGPNKADRREVIDAIASGKNNLF